MIVVLDTNVLVSAIRSRRGASFRVLSLVGAGYFDIAISVPLVLEYEDAMLRSLSATNLGEDDIGAILDFVCSVARHQTIFYLWRPIARDPKNDMVAELAVAAGADAIVTHNLRDFAPVSQLGLRTITPHQLLIETGTTQ
ncbi:MAG: putative toxin-antitoxin system toxin component, PIN family [Myxococcales bacterium]|nr:putative toxin-antitoxin system toxin component, PIN family [Myxococcales bacterium]